MKPVREVSLIAAGLCASLVGIGLARFAYTPLIPPLIAAHWFGSDDVVFLAAANLLGYLLGATLGRVNQLVSGSPAQQQAAWAKATTAFAVVQAAAGTSTATC